MVCIMDSEETRVSVVWMADEIMQGARRAGIETAAYVVLVCAVELCGLENSIWGRILFASGVCRELGGLEMCGFVLVGAAEGSCACGDRG